MAKQEVKGRAIWLSYDLGIDGDYDGLYEWLDAHNAIECGDNFAYLRFDAPLVNFDDALLAALKASVKLRSRDRIYAIRPKPNGTTYYGRFIVGGRKRAIWEGRASAGGEVDEP